jgi:hypothetical protein
LGGFNRCSCSRMCSGCLLPTVLGRARRLWMSHSLATPCGFSGSTPNSQRLQEGSQTGWKRAGTRRRQVCVSCAFKCATFEAPRLGPTVARPSRPPLILPVQVHPLSRRDAQLRVQKTPTVARVSPKALIPLAEVWRVARPCAPSGEPSDSLFSLSSGAGLTSRWWKPSSVRPRQSNVSRTRSTFFGRLEG